MKHSTLRLGLSAVGSNAVIGRFDGGGSPEQIEALRTYGRSVGLAFQIADDILDIEGEA